MNSNNPLVSIIVPVFNAEKYLCRLLDSLCSQSYVNIEIIMIDDGSSDESKEIIQKYACNDTRIHYIWQENAGVSAARNTGLGSAIGEWVSFIDADDWVGPSFIESLIPKDKRCDISISGLIKVNEKNKQTKWPLFNKDLSNSKSVGVLCEIDQLMTNFNQYALTGPVCKLFKLSLIKERNLSFPLDMSFGEDSFFVFSYLNEVKRVYVVNDWEYFYYYNSTSLSNNADAQKKELAACRIYNLSLQICNKNNIEDLSVVQYHYVDGLLQIVNNEGKNEYYIRKRCYELIGKERLLKSVKQNLPFYFPFFAKIRLWYLYDIITRVLY